MKLKRLVASISASFDDLVSKIENHEAVAEVTIQEIRAAAAKIRTQLNITHQRIEYLQNQEQSLNNDCRRWQERAVQCSQSDKERALRCIQALEQTELQKTATAQQIRENLRLQKELQQHLETVERRLGELQLKRDSLSARTARNKVTRHIEKTLPGSDPDTVFARWEESVLTDEYSSSPIAETSAEFELDAEFRQQENHSHLEARLAQLVGQKKDVDSTGA